MVSSQKTLASTRAIEMLRSYNVLYIAYAAVIALGANAIAYRSYYGMCSFSETWNTWAGGNPDCWFTPFSSSFYLVNHRLDGFVFGCMILVCAFVLTRYSLSQKKIRRTVVFAFAGLATMLIAPIIVRDYIPLEGHVSPYRWDQLARVVCRRLGTAAIFASMFNLVMAVFCTSQERCRRCG